MDKIGACVLIPTSYDYNVFAGLKCSRGRGYILPGGKFELGRDKTYRHTAAREVWEEIGYKLKPEDLQYIWHGPDGYGYTTFVFKYDTKINVTDLPEETEAGKVCNVGIPDLMRSEFAPYYDIIFHILKLDR